MADVDEAAEVRNGLDAPLTTLTGVGPARAEGLSRLGVVDIRGLLCLMPIRVEVAPEPTSAAKVAGFMGDFVGVRGTVTGVRFAGMGWRRSSLRVTIEDESGTIDAVFFNQPWMRQSFVKDSEVELRGRVIDSRGPALSTPKVGTEEKPLPAPGSLEVIYPTTDGIGQQFLRKLCAVVLEAHADELADPVPAKELQRGDLVKLSDAVRGVHAPHSEEHFRSAQRRMRLEPLLELQAHIHGQRRALRSGSALEVSIDDATNKELLAQLPFELTPGQAQVCGDLRRDLQGPQPMRRLLQGDVGCGKTLVGIHAALMVARAGGQTAFLAPTELLVEQHFDGLRSWLERAGLRSDLLTSGLRARARREVLARLELGQTDIVFGTHALFSDDVNYQNLALVVVDEQHRFGVRQRAKLFAKGRDAHGLLMTATPIPRTLALTLYGDLDTSSIHDRPKGRGKVRTRWVRPSDEERIEPFVCERITAGERVFWVSPRIDGDAELGLTGANDLFERLQESELAAGGIELVHGRQDAGDRARRLERFRRGEVSTLVATTVIEVGVDVPEATVMVIENAERMGIAQLHQLRGRVGRGAADSWCLLRGTAGARERFELLERVHDGFELAEEDLRQRGMGDLCGVRQAGQNFEGLGSVGEDVDLFFLARDLIQSYPDLCRHYDRETFAELTP